MFNSVARYLWGSADDEAQEYTDHQAARDEVLPAHNNAEHLNIQQDEDWVVVGTAADKENTIEPTSQHCTNLPQDHHHHHTQQPPRPSRCSHTPVQQGDREFSTWNSASHNHVSSLEHELLDDAASLAMTLRQKGSMLSTRRYDNCDLTMALCESDGHDSSDESAADSGMRPSSPESVFSACSGRSHATYRARGFASEPWVMAPAPCFTGSQVEELGSMASSPLENLLIEHPSMSVYLSVPVSSLPSSHPFHSSLSEVTRLDGGPQSDGEDQAEADHRPDERGDSTRTGRNMVQCRNRILQAAINVQTMNQDVLIRKTRDAQIVHQVKVKKCISRQKCNRQNKLHDSTVSTKGLKNKHNKRVRPSCCKASRTCQRM